MLYQVFLHNLKFDNKGCMQFKQTGLLLSLFVLPFLSYAQTTYLPQGAKENVLLERFEIRAGTDSILNFSKARPFSRRQVIPHLGRLDSLATSPVDRYNLYTAMASNLEWATGSRDQYASRKPLWKHFFQTPANLYEVNTPDFYLSVNPVFQYYVGKEKDNDQHIFLNTRGVTLRGRIANRIGFSAYLTDNQERDPLYVQRWEQERKAVPGQGYYKQFKTTGYDYFDARGTITFSATRYIDIAFGYDRNFIGNGYRSLFLSDFTNSNLFLKLNTRIWKFNYQNLFMELHNASNLRNDNLIPKKYAAIHHLDLAVTKWLNIGFFEAIVFGRKDHFEFGYLNPVIFYRSIEQQNGSFDNALAGLDFKANIARRFQVYGQLLLDEFKLSEIKANRGWWGNKYGYQLGAKYIDAFNIRNLDLQVETNRVRPFTYSHNDSVANYTHYNQPLAHPLGANFGEYIGLARYQPAPKWMLQGKAIYYVQGRDSSALSYGGNILKPNIAPFRTEEYGFSIGSGRRTNVAYLSLLVQHEFRPNLFFEANAVYRREAAAGLPAASTMVIYAGIRWNMHRREFDF
jgi:hypothetical protein